MMHTCIAQSYLNNCLKHVLYWLLCIFSSFWFVHNICLADMFVMSCLTVLTNGCQWLIQLHAEMLFIQLSIPADILVDILLLIQLISTTSTLTLVSQLQSYSCNWTTLLMATIYGCLITITEHHDTPLNWSTTVEHATQTLGWVAWWKRRPHLLSRPVDTLIEQSA